MGSPRGPGTSFPITGDPGRGSYSWRTPAASPRGWVQGVPRTLLMACTSPRHALALGLFMGLCTEDAP